MINGKPLCVQEKALFLTSRTFWIGRVCITYVQKALLQYTDTVHRPTIPNLSLHEIRHKSARLNSNEPYIRAGLRCSFWRGREKKARHRRNFSPSTSPLDCSQSSFIPQFILVVGRRRVNFRETRSWPPEITMNIDERRRKHATLVSTSFFRAFFSCMHLFFFHGKIRVWSACNSPFAIDRVRVVAEFLTVRYVNWRDYFSSGRIQHLCSNWETFSYWNVIVEFCRDLKIA